MATEEIQVRRIDLLAQPKPQFHDEFAHHRRSVYWIDRKPFTPGPNGTTQIVASRRVRELANPRALSAHYRFNRNTAITSIKRSTLRREPTGHLLLLSQPRAILATEDRSAYSSVPKEAPPQKTLDHLDYLSQPRDRVDRFMVNETHWGQYYPVSFAAQTAHPSSRIEDLAREKSLHPDFKDERPVQTVVPEHALTSFANQHLKTLARPRARTMIIDDYDPYKVSASAMRTKPSTRTELLATPLLRKQRNRSKAV